MKRIRIDDYGIVDAYWRGAREGHDPEVAEDLGIPIDPETVEEHFKSGETVRALLARAAVEADRLSLPAHERVKCGDCNKPECLGCKY